MKRSVVVGTLVVLSLVGTLVVYGFGQEEEKLTYTFGQVARGDVESVVVTTGTLAALNTVVVGSGSRCLR